jgi:hypothetical protein
VLVTGPPGIGKSRLRHEFSNGCKRRGQPLTRLIGFGDPAAGRWRFRHALMCDAAYGLLTPEDAVVLHARAASYLKARGEEPAVVAAHAERGNERTLAVAQYTLAAERAYRKNDLGAVVSLVARGIACGAQGEALGVLLNTLAPALSYRNDFASGWAASERALALFPPGHPKRMQSLAANPSQASSSARWSTRKRRSSSRRARATACSVST